jgi:hypothetical protein
MFQQKHPTELQSQTHYTSTYSDIWHPILQPAIEWARPTLFQYTPPMDRIQRYVCIILQQSPVECLITTSSIQLG